MEGFLWPNKRCPVAFVEMGREGCEEMVHDSKRNPPEAQRLLQLLHAILKTGHLQPAQVIPHALHRAFNPPPPHPRVAVSADMG